MKRLWISGISMVMFILLVFMSIKKTINGFDNKLIELIYMWRTPVITGVMKGATTIGNPSIVIITVVGLSIFLSYKKLWRELIVFIGVMVVNSGLLTPMMKYLIRRDRPIGYRLISESGFSFPSGHAIYITSLVLIIIWLVSNHLPKYYIATSGIGIGVIVLVSFSRVYLGVHYPTDVIGGILLALSSVSVIIEGFNRAKN